MFDKAIIEMDVFLNVSLGAKALYFLLGMEADDEGFVSPARVMRLYGTELGDLKNLIDTGLIIPFQSGVVVITDWEQNNWLDKRRIKPTQYQKEKEQLVLTDNKRYVLSGGLANAKREESSIEENRREEGRMLAGAAQTPKDVAKAFFSSEDKQLEVLEKLKQKGINPELALREIKKFVSYWTEKNKSGTKERWEGERFFDLNRRLATWFSNYEKFAPEKDKKPKIAYIS